MIICYGESKKNPFTTTYGLGRSFLALSLITVFLFNDIAYLFNEDALNVIANSNFFHNKINLFGIIGFDNLIYAKTLSIVILLLVISGYFPQLTGLLHFWVTYSFHNAAILLDGGEQIAVIYSCLILPLTLFDRRINHWHQAKNQNSTSRLVGHLTFFLIGLQTAYLYLNTAVEKLYKLK